MNDNRDPFRISYADNTEVTVADRLAAEIGANGSRLWVATGYFGASMWAAIGEALDPLVEFRLLVGKDYELKNLDVGSEARRIADLVRQAIRKDTEPPHLPSRDEAEHVAALIRFLERQRGRGDPVVKLWEGEGFFHAKAYILKHSVGIGSANFTYPGLMTNRELVGWRQDYGVVAEAEEWFDRYWNDPLAVDYTEELLEVLRATPLVSEAYRPYDVLIRTLAARYGIDRPPSLEQVTFSLKWFQEDAVARLVRLLNGRARGALLADAVGLGKTYMAMGVIHHYLYGEIERRRGRGKPVLLVIPASLERMWTRALAENGLDWACEIVTTQSLRSDFDPGPYAGAELIVIDEAHRLRGGGTWFRKAIDLVTAGDRSDRRVLLLTATPVNTSIEDLINELRVLTKNQRQVWAPEVADFERHLQRVERGETDPFPVLDRSIVRRSRSDILRAQQEARDAGVQVDEVKLPDRQPAHVDHDYGGSEDLFSVFSQVLRELELAPYDLERFRLEEPVKVEQQTISGLEDMTEVDPGPLAIRPGTLAALCAVGLLVRFQSSLAAIDTSLRRVDAVLKRCAEGLAADPPRLLDLRSNPLVQRLLAQEAHADAEADEEDNDGPSRLDRAWEGIFASAPVLADAHAYGISAIQESILRDRGRIAQLQSALPPRETDGKVVALIAALDRKPPGRPGKPGLAGRRVLIFSQFRDTAIYLEQRLSKRYRTARVDGSVSSEARSDITAWFDPERIGEAEASAHDGGRERPDILISTDVLAEGHNLQLADVAVNYDLHFNPQVAVQRSGRIDRIGSPHDVVHLVSFLPPEPLERHIGLLARLDDRFRRIHGLGLGDERVMPLAGDRPGKTLEQMRRLYLRDDPSVLDEVERSWTLGSTDYMRQPLEAYLQRAGRDQIDRIPMGVSSVKRVPREWRFGPGVFIALAGPPNRDGERESHWLFYPKHPTELWHTVVRDEVEIFRGLVCRDGEPRLENPWPTPGPTVIDWDLLHRAAKDLAGELTQQRATAQLVAGASERSRQLRNELRANLSSLNLDGSAGLLDRLLQVRVEDYDGRSGWSRFEEARRRLRGAKMVAEARAAGEYLVNAGLSLFGAAVSDTTDASEAVEVSPESLQLIAYEVLTE